MAGAPRRGWRRFLPSLFLVQTTVFTIQFAALVLAIKVPWPDLFSDALGWCDSLLLDYRLGMPGVEKLDFRAHFLSLGPAPLVAASLVALLSFRSAPVVLWYFALLLSLVLLAAGFAVKLLPGNEFTQDAPTDVFFWAGVGGVAASACLYLAWRWYQKRRRIMEEYEDVPLLPDQIARMVPGAVSMSSAQRGDGGNEGGVVAGARVGDEGDSYGSDSDMWESDSDEELMERRARQARKAGGPTSKVAPAPARRGDGGDGGGDGGDAYSDEDEYYDTEDEEDVLLRPEADMVKFMRPRPVWYLILHLVIVLAVIVAGVLGLLYVRAENDLTASLTGPLRATGEALAIFTICVGSLLVVHWAMTLTYRTRAILWRALLFWRTNFISLMFFCMFVTYIPITNTLLAAWTCVDSTCADGEIYPDKDIRLDSSAPSSFVATAACIPCPYLGGGCGANLTAVLCTPDDTDKSRLFVDPSLSCSRHIYPYFTPASVILVLGYVLACPMLYFKVTRDAAVHLGDIEVSKLPIFSGGVNGVGVSGIAPRALRAAQIALTSSRAAPLYSPHPFGWRHLPSFVCVEALLAVVFSLFVRDVTASLVLSCVLHVAMAVQYVLGGKAKTLMRDTDRVTALGCRLSVILLCVYGLCVEHGGDSARGDTAAVVVTLLAFVMPLVGLVLGYLLDSKVAAAVGTCLSGDFSPLGTRDRVRKEAIVFGLAASHRRELVRKEKEAIKAFKREKVRSGGGGGGAHGAELGNAGAVSAQRIKSDDPRFDEQVHTLEVDPDEIPYDPFLEHLRSVDRTLNRVAVDALTSFFMLVGVVALVAVCVVLVGIVHASTTSLFIPQAPLVASTSPTFAADHEFAKYADWQEFTSECCCSVGSPTFKYPLVEHWGCTNSFTKMKAREARLTGSEASDHGGQDHSGIGLRGLCSTSFAPGVCPEPFYEVPDPTLKESVQRDFRFYRVDVCNATRLPEEAKSATDYAYHRLW